MRPARLVRRSLTYYWRTNVAVVLGVATAVAVLAGALLVGHSVRASLADLVQQRLGSTDFVIASPLFFREALADDLSGAPRFADAFRTAVPVVVADAVVTAQDSGRRADRVRVYGVDERFWRFHGLPPLALESRGAALSPALAREIAAGPGTAVLIRVQRPSDIPLESLHSRKDETGRTLRLTTSTVLGPGSLGDFSLDARQGEVLAAFVPLSRLQQELEVGDRVNTILVARSPNRSGADDTLRKILAAAVTAEDVGITVRPSDGGGEAIVGSSAGVMDDRQADAVRTALTGQPQTAVFTYLANTMRVRDREVPYSLVTGMNAAGFEKAAAGAAPRIVLNTWAARDLAAFPGDRLTLEYYVWEEPGRLATRTAAFEVGAIVPIETGSRDLAPAYPGISDTSSVSEWDPPFPLDLRRVRPIDEDYWNRYRTTPKAFVDLETARTLWGSRYGSLTSIRVPAASGQPAAAAVAQVRASLHGAIDAESFGLSARDIRSEGLAASQGATDFGEYFLYFSFFLVVSALLLVVLFFKLGVEQRVREVGLLRAVGLSPPAIRRLFTAEGLVLSCAGSLLGTAGALLYSSLLITALTTRWVDAVGTTGLTLHVSAGALAAGAIGGVAASAVCIWWTLRTLARISERSLLAGDISTLAMERPASKRTASTAAILAASGLALAALASSGLVPAAAGFFGAGGALLVSALTSASILLRRSPRRSIGDSGRWPVAHLAARNAGYRPGRSVLSMAVIASATFILVSVDAFRREGRIDTRNPHGGTGGYQLTVQTLLPIVHDPNSAAGRDALNLQSLDRSTAIEPFRVRPGDDASCLNLYQPANPRIIAPGDAFLAAGRFAFQDAAAATDAERTNPWLLLNRVEPDGAIPVVADANSMTYVLHRAIGDTFVLTATGKPVTLRFVASLRDSIFQSELIMSDANFRRLFPDIPGYHLLLVETGANAADAAQAIEQGLSDAGADASGTGEYLASFHRVENTYLSTFQTLGGLGLLLGTVGLATVLLRNVLERRRELALLAAVGYRRSHFLLMAGAENLLLVGGGLAAGAICAAIAIAPAVAERGGRLPISTGIVLILVAVFAGGILSSLAAMVAATKTPLLEALRTE